MKLQWLDCVGKLGQMRRYQRPGRHLESEWRSIAREKRKRQLKKIQGVRVVWTVKRKINRSVPGQNPVGRGLVGEMPKRKKEHHGQKRGDEVNAKRRERRRKEKEKMLQLKQQKIEEEKKRLEKLAEKSAEEENLVRLQRDEEVINQRELELSQME